MARSQAVRGIIFPVLMVDERTSKEEHGGWITEARGRRVRQLDPVRLHVWHRYEVIDAETLEAIVEDLEPGTARMRRRAIVLVPASISLVGILLIIVYLVSDAAGRRDLISTLINPAIMLPSILCFIIVPWSSAHQARLKRIRFAMLRHRRCPHCGYDLRGLPTDTADRTTVCPECGCAWLIDDAAIAAQLSGSAISPADRARQKKVSVIIAGLLAVLAIAGVVAFLMMS